MPDELMPEQQLEYKVHGLFKACAGDEGKIGTRWLTMMEMAEGAGPRRTLESLRLYEQRYAQARRAHWFAALAILAQRLPASGPFWRSASD